VPAPTIADGQSAYAFCRFFLRPGGASNVTLLESCRRTGGNFGWGSVVSQRRKLGSGFSECSVFSSTGSHETTRCTFCRHTHAPSSAPASSSRSAASLWPCPIASWRYFPGPSARSAACSSITEGSAPGVMMNMIGVSGRVSFASSGMFSVARLTLLSPRRSHANVSIALCMRSGRSACTSRIFWNGESCCARGGNARASSGALEPSQSFQAPSSSSPMPCTSAGMVAASRCSAGARSDGTQRGALSAACVVSATASPTIKPHCPAPSASGCIPYTRCIAKVSLRPRPRQME